MGRPYGDFQNFWNQDPCVHVSAVPLTQQSHSETMSNSGGLNDSNSPLVAITTMVSTPASTLYGPSYVFSILPGSIVTTGTEVHLGWKIVPSAHMKAVMQHYKVLDFQKIEVSRLPAAPSRPSTNRLETISVKINE